MREFMTIFSLVTALLFALPATAAPVGGGMFTGASGHKTAGSVTVTKQDGRYIITLSGDFSFDGAPDPYVALGTGTRPSQGGLVAVLSADKGGQTYSIKASPALDTATQVIIWCKKYAVPLGVAAIK